MAKSSKKSAPANAPASTAPEPDAPPVETDPLAGLSDDGAQPFVDDLLQQASDLGEEKEELFGRITANRETLRTIAKTGLLSEKQAAAILLWYPLRQKKANGEEEGSA